MRRCTEQIQPVLCGSALHGIGVQPLLDAVAALSAQPARHAAGRGHRSDGKSGQRQAGRRSAAKIYRKPDPERAVLRARVQDPALQDGRPVLGPDLLGRAEAQQSRVEPRQGQERERRPAVADSCHEKRRATRPVPRPATSCGVIGLRDIDHRRHALRHPRADPARNRSNFPRR